MPSDLYAAMGEVTRTRTSTSTAIEMIEEERERQIAKGYDAKHDDEQVDGGLAALAANYAFIASECAHPTLDNLAKAGALIVAEMERVQRVQQRSVSRRILAVGDATTPVSAAEALPPIRGPWPADPWPNEEEERLCRRTWPGDEP